MRIIGYTYEADYHCVDCAQKRWNPKLEHQKDAWPDEHGISAYARDNEGNPIHPMFSTDEQLEPQYCGDCHERIES